MKKLFFTLVATALLVSSQSCDKDDSVCEGSRKGTIETPNGLDSCGFVIKFSDGTYVTPINLFDYDMNAFSGQKVNITYDTFNVAYPCTMGPTVLIRCLD